MKRNADSLNRGHLLRNILVTGALLLLLVVLVYAFRTSILTGIADYLIASDKLQPADIIFVLNGDYNTRPFYAAELYQQGLAPWIVMARAEDQPAVELGLVSNETFISENVMIRLGVPPERIITLQMDGRGATSTYDETMLLRQYVVSSQVHSIIVVTSAFHTRRAKWIFDRELSGLPLTLEMAAAPQWQFDQTNWWQSETGLITLNNEYIKLVYYFFKYR